MNPILKLFDEKFVISFLKKRILSKYPNFKNIEKVEIQAHKKYIWHTTYHVVLEFKTYFVDNNNQIEKLSIFCAAHSSEPRKNLYDALNYLWDNDFENGDLTVPHALFYSPKFKATFYRGVSGHNLYHYIRINDRDSVEKIIPKTASWFAKLHNMPTAGVKNFNKKNSLIRTVIPGRKKILNLIGERYPQYSEKFKNLYKHFIHEEEYFLNRTEKRWLTHGDAHPENVIVMGEDRLSLIDFNDICLSDFARDLGCFLQQFEYMCRRKIKDKNFSKKMKKLFLDTYLKEGNIKLTKSLENRIDNYYNWTAIRTATFFLLKSNPNPEKAVPLMDKISKKLNIK